MFIFHVHNIECFIRKNISCLTEIIKILVLSISHTNLHVHDSSILDSSIVHISHTNLHVTNAALRVHNFVLLGK